MKKNDALLGSGGIYFVTLKEGNEYESYILDEKEYNVFFDGLNNDAKFLKVGDAFHFWGKIDKFGPVPFAPDGLTMYSALEDVVKEKVISWLKKRAKTNSSIVVTTDVMQQAKNLSEGKDQYAHYDMYGDNVGVSVNSING